jgi:hypothetical protein
LNTYRCSQILNSLPIIRSDLLRLPDLILQIPHSGIDIILIPLPRLDEPLDLEEHRVYLALHVPLDPVDGLLHLLELGRLDVVPLGHLGVQLLREGLDLVHVLDHLAADFLELLEGHVG